MARVFKITVAVALIGLFIVLLIPAKEVDPSLISPMQQSIEQSQRVDSGNLDELTHAQSVAKSTTEPPTAEEAMFACLPDLESITDSFVDIENIKLRQQHRMQRLAESTLESDRLAYAMFNQDQPGLKPDPDTLFELFENGSDNPLLAKELIQQCTQIQDARCTNELIELAISKDKYNGAIWIEAINYYAKNDNDEAVLAAIDSLLSAPGYNERWGEKLIYYVNAMAAQGVDVRMSTIDAIGKSAATMFGGSALEWCKAQHQVRSLQACERLGQTMFDRGRTKITKAIGVGILQNFYEAQGDTQAVDELRQKFKESYKPKLQSNQSVTSLMQLLDERLLLSWLNGLDTLGELKAHQLMSEEAEFLYELNEHQMCSWIYNVLMSITDSD
ncbi:hypothetical protein [Shewanella maritima]|uniref:hypothetical protein n=1 Tax=Shewanella maritima TaxID=2520507 RepID=UPI003735B173